MQLLRRTTRSVGVTEAGQAFYAQASQATLACRAAYDTIALQAPVARGLVRVTAPSTWGRRVVAPLLAEFFVAHPHVQVQLLLLDRPVDLADEGFDLALRLAARPPDGMVAKPLKAPEFVLCAAPGAHAAKVPADLANLPCLRYGEGDRDLPWRFKSPDGSACAVKVAGPLMVNSAEALREAVLQGTGIALLPTWLVGEDLKAKRLRRLLPRWQAAAPIAGRPWLMWLPDRMLPLKTRALAAHLADRLAD